MKQYLSYSIFAICLVCSIISCKKNDHNYSDIIKNGEINYTGKVDSVKTFPGNNRIKFTYLLKSDPKITRVVVYWNDFKDSVVQPVTRSNNVDTITTFINSLPEGSYTFTFVTYDNNGNSSVKSEIASTVYGPNYSALLGNRPRVTSEYGNSGSAVISWFIPDPQVIGTRIVYTDNSNVTRTVFSSSSVMETILPNFKQGTNYELTTLHQPQANMIDTLKAPPLSLPLDHIEVTSTYLKNPGDPFTYTAWDGIRYGNLKDWIVTTVNNKPSSFGSYDNIENTASMAISRFGSEVAVANGRIHQTVTLPAGTYRFIVYFNDTVTTSPIQLPFSVAGATNARVVVASGTILPAASPTTANSRAFTTLNEKSTAIFTLTATTQVSMGIWANYPLTVEAYLRASKVKLLKEI